MFKKSKKSSFLPRRKPKTSRKKKVAGVAAITVVGGTILGAVTKPKDRL